MFLAQPIIDKAGILMTNVASITFDGKTVWALVATIFGVIAVFFDDISFINQGRHEDTAIHTEISKLRMSIEGEHKNFRSELVNIKDTNRDRFETLTARMANSETTIQIIKANQQYLERNVNSFHSKLDQMLETKHTHPVKGFVSP